jgi:tetratricopeptide (TPR) repeat protein
MSEEALSAAMDFFAAGDLEGAIESVKKVLAEDPANADAYEMLGEFCKQSGRLDEAIAYAKRLVEIDPRSIMGHVNLSGTT